MAAGSDGRYTNGDMHGAFERAAASAAAATATPPAAAATAAGLPAPRTLGRRYERFHDGVDDLSPPGREKIPRRPRGRRVRKGADFVKLSNTDVADEDVDLEETVEDVECHGSQEEDGANIAKIAGSGFSALSPLARQEGSGTNGLAQAESPPWRCQNMLMIVLALNAAMGGFLFGYDTGVVSGAMLQIRTKQQGFGDLSSFEQEVIVSSTIGAAIIGSLLSGEAQKRFVVGRRGALLHGALLFTLGAIGMGVAQGVYSLTIGRVVVGVAVGIVSHTVPLYISECAPTEIRGRLNTLNNAFIVLGQVIAAFICCVLATSGTPQGWRYMLGLGAVPAAFMGIGFLPLPESPRYVLLRGGGDEASAQEAESILRRLRGGKGASADAAIAEELKVALQGFDHRDESKDAAENQKVNGGHQRHENGALFSKPGIRRALVLGCCVQLLQQVCGINTLMYYSATILEMSHRPAGLGCMAEAAETSKSGSEQVKNICQSAFVAMAQLIGSAAGMVCVDRCGRRPLLLGSLAGVACSLGALGAAFNGKGLGQGAPLYAMIAYLIFYGAGLGPIPWVLNAEIYPLEARSTCIGVATAMNWVANFVVAATFLDLSRVLSTDPSCPQAHPDGAFWLYGMCTFVGFVGLAVWMPETKGKSLEEITSMFVNAGPTHSGPQESHDTVDQAHGGC